MTRRELLVALCGLPVIAAGIPVASEVIPVKPSIVVPWFVDDCHFLQWHVVPLDQFQIIWDDLPKPKSQGVSL